MKKFFYRLAQWTWGLPQTLAGFAAFLIYRKQPHREYRSAIVTRWNRRGSVALGMYIFLSRDAAQDVLVHEYGHTIQSLILGPLFLILVGLPSLLWAELPMLQKRRRAKRRSYYAFYTERWANSLAAGVTKEMPPK